MFRIGENTFYDQTNKIPMKVPEFKRSGIRLIAEFRGIPNGFPNQVQQQVLQMRFDNYNLANAPELVSLQAAKKFPCYVTCICWIQLFYQTRDICPLRPTGCQHAEREVQGADLE
jgi:hypothetical protein